MPTHAHNTDTHPQHCTQHHQRDHNTYANLRSRRWHTALQHGHSHHQQLNSRHTLATCTPPATPSTCEPAATPQASPPTDTTSITANIAHWCGASLLCEAPDVTFLNYTLCLMQPTLLTWLIFSLIYIIPLIRIYPSFPLLCNESIVTYSISYL